MWNMALRLCLASVFLKFLWNEYISFNWELAGYFLKFQNLNEWEIVTSLNSPNSCYSDWYKYSVEPGIDAGNFFVSCLI